MLFIFFFLLFVFHSFFFIVYPLSSRDRQGYVETI
nr:MAG TPA: hypothetical protein [Caudoviricetes sp.]